MSMLLSVEQSSTIINSIFLYVWSKTDKIDLFRNLSLLKLVKITDTKIFNSKDQYLKGVIILKLSSEDIKIINQ